MKWQKVKLGEVATFQNGVGKGKEFYGRGAKVANIGDLYESPSFQPVKYSLLDVTKKEIENYSLKRGDLLFVRSSVKRSGVAVCSAYDSDEECLFSSFMIRARLNSHVDGKFLAYYLRTPSAREELINSANTSTITNISQPGLARVEIPLPPLDEQKRIASILDAADALRRVRRQSLGRLDELAQSLFLELFGDPATNPKGWEVVKLEDVCIASDTINYGVVQPGEEVINGVPVVRVGDLEPIRITRLAEKR